MYKIIKDLLFDGLKGDAYSALKKEANQLLEKIGINTVQMILIKSLRDLEDDGVLEGIDIKELENEIKKIDGLKANIGYQEFAEIVGKIVSCDDKTMKKLYITYQYKVEEKITLQMVDQDIHELSEIVKKGQKEIIDEIKAKGNVPLSFNKILNNSKRIRYVDLWVEREVFICGLKEDFEKEGYILNAQNYEKNIPIEDWERTEHHLLIYFDEPSSQSYVKSFLKMLDEYLFDEDIDVYGIYSH